MIWTDVAILFGAGFTIATCLALGSLWLRLAALPLLRAEHWLFSFLCGAATLSGMVFLLCCIGQAHRNIFLLIGIAAIASAAFLRSSAPPSTPPDLPVTWRIAFLTVLALFGVLYFFHAMAPDTSPDGVGYHLWLAQTYLRAHAFVRLDSFFANMPQGLEMLFVFAIGLGRDSSAALVHFAFLMALPLLMLSYGRRAGIPLASAAAALFVFVSPVVGVAGTTTYNDVAATTLTFAGFFLMHLWFSLRRAALLATAGALAGFACSIKYTTGFGLVLALAVILWTLLRRRQPWLSPALAFCLCAAIFILPWTLKSWIWASNPVAPFANRLFPNPGMHITAEDQLFNTLRHYDLTSPSQIPVELMLHGGTLGGILGPLFFAAPLGFFALRWPVGRIILLTGAVLLIPFLSNIGTRFLLPALPFIALAMALAFIWICTVVPGFGQPALLLIVLLNALVCWPSFVALYAPSGIWRISGFRFSQALRIEPEDVWLSREFPPYLVARMVDQFVPPGQKVFSFSIPARAYTHREITASLESGPGEVRRDILFTPLIEESHPTRLLIFTFPPQTLQSIRLVQTAAAVRDLWSVTELRLYAQGRELPRLLTWRLTAQPNPWDVQLAFDNFAVTRWRSWQSAAPGMFLEVAFQEPASVDSLRVQTTTDESETNCRVEALAPGATRWTTLAAAPRQSRFAKNLGGVNLRAEASSVLRNQGFNYLLIANDTFGASDYLERASEWNIKLKADRAGSRLYQILP